MKISLQKVRSTATAFAVAAACLSGVLPVQAVGVGSLSIDRRSNLAVIRGVVRDSLGKPISNASVAIFRNGTSQLLKQVTSRGDGSFMARVLPGKYTVLAVAHGFNPVTLLGVEVTRAAELTYGFNLERAGSGNTLPEKRLDRDSSKWRVRAAQAQRSIYQNNDGQTGIDTIAGKEAASERTRQGQTVVETFAGSNGEGEHVGVKAATLIPVGENSELVLAGQAGSGRGAPQSLYAATRLQPFEGHQLTVSTSLSKVGDLRRGDKTPALSQLSFQALDEWRVGGGVIFVFGVDYSRFIGAGNDFSIAPRLGLQFDLNSKTRVRSSFTTQTQERTWSNALDLEGHSIAFSEPVYVEDLAFDAGRPLMNKSRRLEFGIERVIDNRSNVEANVFFDTTFARGVGLENVGLEAVEMLGDEADPFVANMQGRSQGVRVVYTRKLNDLLTAAGGYSFGNGRKVSRSGISDPSRIFESDFFQTFFAQLAAELKTGTSLRAIYRLSPEATIFAIDPFKGRLAIYDPGLSVMVTQSLPSLGLPFRAQAIVDARNIFDHQNVVSGEEGSFRLSGYGRTLRGGIQVRF
jgi:hypothetical protein